MKIVLPTDIATLIIQFAAPARIDVVRKCHMVRELNEKRVAIQNICWRSETNLLKGYLASPAIMKLIFDWGMNELREAVGYDVEEAATRFETKWVNERLPQQT